MKQIFFNVIRYVYQFVFSKKEDYMDGISVLVCAKDEEYTIKQSLLSVLPFAGQIVLIDNGSTDTTLNEMKSFKKDHESDCEIVIIEAPNMVLKDARNIGLKHINRKWLLKSDSDFIFYTTGKNDAKKVFNKLMETDLYKAYRLAFINLYGDLDHTYKNMDTYKLGEFYFLRMSNKLKFIEENKFDYLKIPRFYLQKKYLAPLFFHLDGLKSTERLLYRNCYFEWRQTLNNEIKDEYKNVLNDYKLFSNLWQKHLLGTEDYQSIKYRFTRQFCELYLKQYKENEYFEYPELVKEMKVNHPRFKVTLKDKIPYYRKDDSDPKMQSYTPTVDDKSWSIDTYNEIYHKKDYLLTIKEEIIGLKLSKN